MIRRHLRVDKVKPPDLEFLHQDRQRDFRRVGFTVKHRLAEKRLAQGHAVKPADELTLEPGFYRMSTTQPVQVNLRLLHLRRDPSAALPFPGHNGASRDHILKHPVEGHVKNSSSQRLLQAARYFKIVEFEDKTRVGRPPEQRLILRIPRENTHPVSFQ